MPGGGGSEARAKRGRSEQLRQLARARRARRDMECTAFADTQALEGEEHCMSPLRRRKQEEMQDKETGAGDSWAERLRAGRTSWRTRSFTPPERGQQEVENKTYTMRPEPPVSGNRICNMDSFVASVLPHVACPKCRRIGTMAAHANDERSAGLVGTLIMTCLACMEHTLFWEHGKPLAKERRENGKMPSGPAHKDLNARAVLGCLHIGIGQQQLERLFGVMELPSLNSNTYNQVQMHLIPRIEDSALRSHSEALADEKSRAIAAGAEVTRTGGRVLIPCAFDAQWMKPGRAMNAADGYGVAMGGRSKKCIMTAYRTKVGPLKNHVGSSGSMEPAMGAEVVVRLGTEPNGVVVGQLCMDLDAKTPKAVAEAVAAACARDSSVELITPQKLHDPNHFMKALRKRFMKVKKLIHQTNVFPPITQKRLSEEVAMAVHQHRGANGTYGLREAILNVQNHAFNQHENCRRFFKCPCAPDEHGVIARSTSSYKDGAWLSEAGGARLRTLLEKEFAAVTTDAHISALDHGYNTQVCKSLNGLHASMHPKRHDMSRTSLGRAVHMLATARYNDGILESTKDILRRLGLELGSVGTIILSKQDRKRAKISKWRQSIHGKRKRKEAKSRRAVRDQCVGGGIDRAYEAGVQLASDVSASNDEAELAEPLCVIDAPMIRRRNRSTTQNKCSRCGEVGHNIRSCPVRPANLCAPDPAADPQSAATVG